jgi:hypothetical protein
MKKTGLAIVLLTLMGLLAYVTYSSIGGMDGFEFDEDPWESNMDWEE